MITVTFDTFSYQTSVSISSLSNGCTVVDNFFLGADFLLRETFIVQIHNFILDTYNQSQITKKIFMSGKML